MAIRITIENCATLPETRKNLDTVGGHIAETYAVASVPLCCTSGLWALGVVVSGAVVESLLVPLWQLCKRHAIRPPTGLLCLLVCLLLFIGLFITNYWSVYYCLLVYLLPHLLLDGHGDDLVGDQLGQLELASEADAGAVDLPQNVRVRTRLSALLAQDEVRRPDERHGREGAELLVDVRQLAQEGLHQRVPLPGGVVAVLGAREEGGGEGVAVVRGLLVHHAHGGLVDQQHTHLTSAIQPRLLSDTEQSLDLGLRLVWTVRRHPDRKRP
eukprot:5678560-Pyramimonas_sp.AAC.1